jgi:hypothetical protein
LERHAYWCEKYSVIARNGDDRQEDGYPYTAEALATFPRYNVLNAIRPEVERLDPATFDHLENTRALLVVAGKTAEDDFTRPPIGEIEQRAITEEREDFGRYIRGLKLSDLNTIATPPYRRVLTVEESNSIRSLLRARWKIAEEYWFPLVDCTLSDVVAFEAGASEESVPSARLQSILTARGVERVWELREYGPEYEEDIFLFERCYNEAEGYWSSGDLDWIIYASHAASMIEQMPANTRLETDLRPAR